MTEINRVLLVDDDSLMLELAEMSLTEIGQMTVCACNSGESALEKITAFRPDIILLDSNMPGLDGPDTLSAIRKDDSFSKVPVVFFTGETRAEEIKNLKEIGAIDVITKPFDPMSLAEKVKVIGKQYYDG